MQSTSPACAGSRHRHSRGRLAGWLALSAAAATAIPAMRAFAVEKDWKAAVGSGNWSTAANWLQGNIPASFDDAVIVHNDSTNRIVTYDYTGIAITLSSLTLDNV